MQTGVPSAFSVQEKRCGGEKRGGIEGEKAEKSWAEQGRGGRKKKFEKNKNSTCQIEKYVLLFISCQREILLLRYAAVAQLDRVFGYEPKGRGFESLQPYHSSQASYRLRRVFSFHYKTYRALTLLLLDSKPKPSVAGSVWFLAQTCSHCIFFVHIFQVKSYILIL